MCWNNSKGVSHFQPLNCHVEVKVKQAKTLDQSDKDNLAGLSTNSKTFPECSNRTDEGLGPRARASLTGMYLESIKKSLTLWRVKRAADPAGTIIIQIVELDEERLVLLLLEVFIELIWSKSDLELLNEVDDEDFDVKTVDK